MALPITIDNTILLFDEVISNDSIGNNRTCSVANNYGIVLNRNYDSARDCMIGFGTTPFCAISLYSHLLGLNVERLWKNFWTLLDDKVVSRTMNLNNHTKLRRCGKLSRVDLTKNFFHKGYRMQIQVRLYILLIAVICESIGSSQLLYLVLGFLHYSLTLRLWGSIGCKMTLVWMKACFSLRLS